MKYDVIVIGSGGAGLTSAKLVHGLGKKVAIIEKEQRLGGECTWTGCVPSKALIKAAHVANHIKHVSNFSLEDSGTLNTQHAFEYVRERIQRVYTTHTPEKIKQLGIDVLFGESHFIDTKTIRVNNTQYTAKKFIICTGSNPSVPPIDGLNTVDYLTNNNLFDLETLPASMTIIGGGAIGCEMASALNHLGVKITLIEMNNRILAHEDKELALMLQDMLRARGVEIITNAQATRVAHEGNEIKVSCSSDTTCTAQKILVAVGRTPSTAGLNLEKAEVNYTKRGIAVNKYMQTTSSNIYAAGDVVGPYRFSHMAWHQAVVAAQNACIPFFKKTMSYEHKIWATFTAPELAFMGMTEKQAREQHGDTIDVYRHNYSDIDRGMTDLNEQGMVKVICDHKGYILGAHILGARAGDIIHELQLAKTAGIKFHKLAEMIHAYPTYSELIWHAAKKARVTRLERKWYVRIAKRLFYKK